MKSYKCNNNISSAQATSRHHAHKRRSIRSVPCVRTAASLALMAFTASSQVDTIHAFTESFSVPQHLRLNANKGFQHPSSHAVLSASPNLSRHTFLQPHNRDSPNQGSPHKQTLTNTALFYAPNQHTSQTAPMVAQAIFASHQRNRNPTKPKNRSEDSTMPLSNSVLSSSDTLPAFPTAHGLLSPETVMRMDVMTSHRPRDEALDMFLNTYKKEGPMACLPMLSDENVLPRLTEAMRDILI